MIETWRLDCTHQSLVLVSSLNAMPAIVYYGDRLPDEENLEELAKASQMDVTGGMLDENPSLSICPEASHIFPGQQGMVVRNQEGKLLLPKFKLQSVDHNETHLIITCRDDENSLTYIANFECYDFSNMVVCFAEIKSDEPIHLSWLSAPVFPAPQQASHMFDFSGRWIDEFQINQVPWTMGVHLRENFTGRSGHEHFPGLIIPHQNTTNRSGQAIGFHYGWSGGHRMVAEQLPDGRRQVQFGNASNSELLASTQFKTAPLYVTFSKNGLNGIGKSCQRHVRKYIVKIPPKSEPRPVHYNCWEAVYFDHNIEELKEIASLASKLGAERFVLDDGWFGKRNDDTTSLGDWWLDEVKYPDGLTPLIDHVKSCGMQFGIWFEPEMINPDSETYKAHPNWLLGKADQIQGRQQWVLDMALQEVQNYLFNAISKILTENDISYIKWDHNRVLPYSDAAQIRGTYKLINRLTASHPEVEIESCSSGGGRSDFGMLEHTQRVWLSDSNDAIERLKIQHNSALFLPSKVTGSHVGPRHCHTSGRVLDIELRAWVAASRHMGFEMDPRELDERERKILSEICAWWKDNRHWLMEANILRLDVDDKAIIAEQQLAEDGERFVVFAGMLESSKQILPRPLCLTSLERNAYYEVTLKNKDSAPKLSRGSPFLKHQTLKLSGAYLMQQGLNLPWQFPQNIWVIEGKKL